ncbi:DNA/RNA non-specific endonuclease, partial [Sinomonas albida]|uniref:DNA/RNA non-specific endonuclease n=1 Tax=Sinomonas albida TaxID=369942 RepID=UPI0030177177
GDASKLSKLAAIGDLTDPVSLVAKGAHLALPKLSDLASALGSKFDDLKGLVSDHMPNFKDGTFHFGGSHAEPEIPAGRPEPAAPHVHQPVVEPVSAGGVHGETVYVGERSGAHSGGSGGHGGGELGSGGGRGAGSGGADSHAPHPGDTPGEPRTPDERPALPQDYPRPEAHHEVTVTGRDVPGSRTPFAQRTDLEPNTMYHVEGRGDFYTDAHGHVTYVETTYGGKGNLNADLMKPQPDTTYVVHPDVTNPVDGASHAHVFHTDSEGRTDLAHTDRLALGEADRSESVQSRVGDEGGTGYDGGHLFGNDYGGGGEYANMTAMLRDLNRGAGDSFYNLENSWRTILRDDPAARIDVDIRPHYVGDSKVPDKFFIDYSVNDGDIVSKEFSNV